MSDILKELKSAVSQILPQVACFIGYRAGFDPLHNAPLFIREAGDDPLQGGDPLQGEIEQLRWDRFCVHNLAAYLPPQKYPSGYIFTPGEKIGVLLKGCDSRAVIQLLQEGILKRDNLVILGLPCQGMIDINKLGRRIGIQRVTEAVVDGQTVTVFSGKDRVSAGIGDVLYDKCLACQYPNTLIYDKFIGEKLTASPSPRPSPQGGEGDYNTLSPLGRGQGEGGFGEQISKLEHMSLAERAAFWENEFARCIRCKACRNVCPLCYCQNQCLLDTRVPRWARERVDGGSNLWFHLIRAFHLAGRCTECGECARGCPMNIPVNLLPMKMNQELFELFGWRPGVSEDEKSPLMTFRLEEEKIK